MMIDLNPKRGAFRAGDGFMVPLDKSGSDETAFLEDIGVGVRRCDCPRGCAWPV
jgi:hypothetical protein